MEFVAISGPIKKAVQTVAKVSDEAFLTRTEDGLVFTAIDAARACYVKVVLDEDVVDIDAMEGEVVGVNIATLADVCKTVPGTVEVGWSQPDGQIQLRAGRSVHIIPQLPVDTLRPIPPNAETMPPGKVRAGLPGPVLREAVLSVKPLSDSIRIVASPAGVSLSAVGAGRQYRMEVPKEDLMGGAKLPAEAEARTMIQTAYLTSQIALFKSADGVYLGWDQAGPIRVRWEVEPGVNAFLVVAPLVDLDDSDPDVADHPAAPAAAAE